MVELEELCSASGFVPGWLEQCAHLRLSKFVHFRSQILTVIYQSKFLQLFCSQVNININKSGTSFQNQYLIFITPPFRHCYCKRFNVLMLSLKVTSTLYIYFLNIISVDLYTVSIHPTVGMYFWCKNTTKSTFPLPIDEIMASSWDVLVFTSCLSKWFVQFWSYMYVFLGAVSPPGKFPLYVICAAFCCCVVVGYWLWDWNGLNQTNGLFYLPAKGCGPWQKVGDNNHPAGQGGVIVMDLRPGGWWTRAVARWRKASEQNNPSDKTLQLG